MITPKNIITADFETTGLDIFRSEIITGSLSKRDYETYDLVDELELTFKPTRRNTWTDEAEKVHGITWADSQQFDEKSHSLLKLMQWVGETGSVFLCHANWNNPIKNERDEVIGNSQYYFDFAMLQEELRVLEDDHGINLYRRRRDYFTDEKGMSTHTLFQESYRDGSIGDSCITSKNSNGLFIIPRGFSLSLPNICARHNIELREHHNAKEDRVACERLFRRYRDRKLHRHGEVSNEEASGLGSCQIDMFM